MSLKIVIAVLLVVWFIGAPVICGIAAFAVDRWILQDTPKVYLAGAIGAAIWYLGYLGLYVVSLVVDPHDSPPKNLAAVALVGLFVGATGGPTVLNLWNSAWDRSPGDAVDVKLIYHGRPVEFRPAQGPYAQIVFKCGRSKWASADMGARKFVVHKGRLGLYWGEFE